MYQQLKAPFPWFGGKSRAASLIWQGLGDVVNYVEPFFGSGAALLLRENYDPLLHTETVNDLDSYLANFWRALSADPAEVAYWTDAPVNEADLHARHLWLVNQDEFREKMLTDPDFYDAKIAGWWVWGLCQWIGSGWCHINPRAVFDSALGNNGRGVHRKLPHLQSEPQGSRADQGVCASPASSLGGQRYGSASQASLHEYFYALANRLRRVRVCCGDWKRVLGPSPTFKLGLTGIVLDPPYDQKLRNGGLYSVETEVSAEVREWAIAHGGNPSLRIVLCGYCDEHLMPETWQCVEWSAGGGYDGQNKAKANQNRLKERIWFSPHCLKIRQVQQLSLLAL